MTLDFPFALDDFSDTDLELFNWLEPDLILIIWVVNPETGLEPFFVIFWADSSFSHSGVDSYFGKGWLNMSFKGTWPAA